MSILVKICGITNVDDAIDALELGADYLGFNFYSKSPRFLTYEKFDEILSEVPYSIGKVGVFVNEDVQTVIDVATHYELGFLQFHGEETPEYCNQFARPYIRAMRPQKESDLDVMASYDADFFLIDSYVQNAFGGTGVVSNWDLAKAAKEKHANIMLSGGLNPDNVELAVCSVRPYAVDVCSGVEEKPGKKSYRKMEEFIKIVKNL
ncbi:MAG: phosphoribosylanthranilate isomerase [bacterium]|nr:phosphoribosylanthranilate isomerase [bacterium]MBU1918210.1 phosphoribosylanthranilate isomerase [bacterium]